MFSLLVPAERCCGHWHHTMISDISPMQQSNWTIGREYDIYIPWWWCYCWGMEMRAMQGLIFRFRNRQDTFVFGGWGGRNGTWYCCYWLPLIHSSRSLSCRCTNITINFNRGEVAVSDLICTPLILIGPIEIMWPRRFMNTSK